MTVAGGDEKVLCKNPREREREMVVGERIWEDDDGGLRVEGKDRRCRY